MKKALAFLTGLMMILPPAAVTAFAAEESISAEPPAAAAPPQPAPHLFAEPCSIPVEDEISIIRKQIHSDIPSRFDLREQGMVTPIRDQGDLGTCWAHATLGSIETERMTDDPHIDLSERYLATYMKSDQYGDGTNDLTSGSDATVAMGLLSNWIGAVPESIAPYSEEYISDSTREEMQQESTVHVTGIHDLGIVQPDSDAELFALHQHCIKQTLCEGHALYMSMNFDTVGSMNCETAAVYNDPNDQVWNEAPHAIVIVGYDDDFSASNFSSPPPADGAWLVKNSWGTNNGKGGYYWVSYYDPTINGLYYFDAVSAEEHDRLYSLDDYGANGLFAACEEGDESVYVSNAYTARENSFITDVMLNIACADDEYEITVYTDLTDPAVPTSGEAHTATVGTAEHTGYQTVTLDTPVHINAGETFAVVARLSGVQGFHIACEYASDYAENGVGFTQYAYGSITSSTLVNEARIMETFGENQSFFSTDGSNWNDLFASYEYDREYLTGNICLRAMTADEGKIRFSSYSDALAPGTELVLSCDDDRDIYYSVNGGEYTLYTAPIVFTEEMTVSAYADGDENTVYTRRYAEKHAEISSLLVQCGDNDCYYADLTGSEELVLSQSAESIVLLPITTGSVTDGKTVTGSYEPREIACGFEPFTVTLTAEEEGLAPTVYNIRIRKETPEQFTSGTWESSVRKGWFRFNEDGETGYFIDRADGSRSEISYVINGSSITFREGDSARKGLIVGDFDSVSVQWEDGSTETFSRTYYYSAMEYESPYFTNPELTAMAKAYMTAWKGEEPKSVTAEFDTENSACVQIKVTAADGTKYEFSINAANAVGYDQDGNVIDLANAPEDTGITEIRPGIWYSLTEYHGFNSLVYYYFDADNNFVSIDTETGHPLAGTYSLKNGQLILSYEACSEHLAVNVYEDTISVTWDYGTKGTMHWLNDETPETFTFLTNQALYELAVAYYAANHIQTAEIHQIMSENEEMAVLTIYDTDNGQWLDYTVSRYTGLGTDQDGNMIDLNHPVEAKQDYFTKGIWKCFMTVNGEMDVFDGYYWFGGEADADAVLYATDNMPLGVLTCRMINGNGCFTFDNGVQEYFTYTVNDDYIQINMFVTDNDTVLVQEKKLVYVKPAEQKDVHIYSMDELAEMACRDYNLKHDGADAEIQIYKMEEDGNVRIVLSDRQSGEYLETYYADQINGTGTTESGEEVNLPQTGITSPVSRMLAVAALLMTGFGFWSVMRSGILRRKEEA